MLSKLSSASHRQHPTYAADQPVIVLGGRPLARPSGKFQENSIRKSR